MMDMEIEEQMDSLSVDLVCIICYAEFLDDEDLKVHIKQVHLTEASKSRFCNICIQVFPDIEAYALHVRNNHLVNLKCCKYCTSVFENTNELIKHEKKHNASALYPKISCSRCTSVFKIMRDLEKHEFQEHKDIEGVTLRDCLPLLSSLLNMNIRRFFEASHSNSPYVCAACDLTTPDKCVYLQHLLDKNCRSLSCNDCCNVYLKKSKLSLHVMRHFNENSTCNTIIMNKKQCQKCKQQFLPVALKVHMKKCTGMSCTHCGLAFDSVTEYTNHISQHTNKMLPLEVCIYCQRQMVGVEAMEKHIERSHKNEKHLYKYHCTDCDRLFKHPKFLFAHFYSTHKDLHPYTCKICNKKFRIRKNFSLHIKLDHKSVGFVEFDDNFHVSFTDKKTNKQSKCQDVLEETVNKCNEKDKTVGNNETGDTTNCEDTDEAETSEQKYQIEIDDQSLPTKPAQLKEHNPSIENKNEAPGGNTKNKHKTVEHENSTDFNDDNNETDSEMKVGQKRKRKLTRRTQKNKKSSKISDNIDNFSDDSDTPLQTICKRMKLQKNTTRRLHQTPWNKRFRNPKTQNKKFVCQQCNFNCYTYQNYHRHKAFHVRNETKVCIKCYANFDSVKALNEHIKTEHSSSKLTETLKKLLEKRKIDETNKTKDDVENDVKDTENESKHLTNSEKFRNTVKKVDFEKCTTKVSITPVDSNKISVKKYLENFMPENNEVKLTMLSHKFSLDTSGVKRKTPLIKLTKFTPEPITHTSPIQLQMPKKFTDDTSDKCEVSVELVQNVLTSNIHYVSEIEEQNYDDNIVYDDYDYNTEEQSRADIPEVAQEVLLVGADEPNNILHTMSISNLVKHDNIAIAHLSPQAPFYKISKLKNLLNDDTQSFVLKEPQKEVPKDITLPNGKKLVNVNPLAHLLDKDTIDEVLKARKLKCPYYKPKLKNITEAITKAMEKLERVPVVKKKT